MIYKLEFQAEAWREWKKLDESVKAPLKKKLIGRLEEPRNPKAALHGLKDCYKIKHASWRLVYQVSDKTITVLVLAVGKRERLMAYDAAKARTADPED